LVELTNKNKDREKKPCCQDQCLPSQLFFYLEDELDSLGYLALIFSTKVLQVLKIIKNASDEENKTYKNTTSRK